MVKMDVSLPTDIKRRFEKYLSAELSKATKDISKRLVMYAKQHHDFDTQSGRLESAIKYKGSITKGLEVYIDERVADYAKYITNGHKSWKADKFLEEALIDNKSWIQNRVNDAVKAAVNKLNR